MKWLYWRGRDIAAHLSKDTVSIPNDIDELHIDVKKPTKLHKWEENGIRSKNHVTAENGMTKKPAKSSLTAKDTISAFVRVCRTGVRAMITISRQFQITVIADTTDVIATSEIVRASENVLSTYSQACDELFISVAYIT